MKFCSLCYGNVEVVEDAHVCKRCGSIFDTQGELVERRNAHIAPEVAAAIDAGALPLETVDGEVSAIDISGVTSQEQAQRVAMRDLKPRYRLRTDGSDWLDYAVTPEEQAQREAHFLKQHVLYERDDADAPDVIKDRNGDITLGLCKVCGKGEAELVESCDPSDSRILDWLQDMHNLHTQVEALYVVDGYRVALTWDDEPMHEFHGESLREAYKAAMSYDYDRDKRRFRKLRP